MAATNRIHEITLSRQLNPDNHVSLLDAFHDACRRYGPKPAFAAFGKAIDFEELDRLSRNFAAWLVSEAGLEYGDRVAIQLPNIVQYPIAAWGILRAGMVVVNTNPMYTQHELLHQFNDSGARTLVVLSDLLPTIERIVHKTGIRTIITTAATDMLSPAAQPESALPGLISWNDVLDAGEALELPVFLSGMDDLAVLQYTGGTTGLPKGAMLTHGNVFSAARSSTLAFGGRADREEVGIAPMPVYHIYGFSVNVISGTLHGRLSVLIPNPRDIDRLIQEMKRWKFTGFAGVNTLFAAMMQHPDFDEIDFSHVDSVISGGAALVETIASEWGRRTGTCIYEGFGMSETSSAGTVNAQGHARLGTVGKPMPGFEMKVVDADGNTLAAGEEGELKIRGPQVMVGYWQRPEATAEALDPDGWLSTGDIATIDEEGFVSIVDRLKDMIIVSGFNVYPNEVEAAVQAHPQVLECAVVGVPDERSGEAVSLFVVANDTQLDADELRNWCRQRLTNYKVPRYIQIRDELPKSSVGKILRRELRDQAAADSGAC